MLLCSIVGRDPIAAVKIWKQDMEAATIIITFEKIDRMFLLLF